MKYEIAKELGLLDTVREKGWKGLSSKDTGRIGGMLAEDVNKRKIIRRVRIGKRKSRFS